MKKILITLFVLLGLLVINFFPINTFYNNIKGKKLYQNKNFLESQKYFEKNKDYSGLYNIGNVNYELSQTEQNLNKQVDLLEKALEFYRNSMKLKFTKQAEFNYNFVKNKLKILKEKKENEKKISLQQGSSAPGEGEEDSDPKGEQAPTQQESSPNGTENSPLEEYKLSEKAKQQIKAYEEQLKKEQKQNSGNFGKVYEEQNTSVFDNFDSFFENDPFFNNSLINDRNEKKDW